MKRILLFSILFISQIFSSTEEEIRNKLDIILSKLPPSTKAGVLIYNPLSEDTIYSLNHTISMIPASNTKLFTTATALSMMGGDFILYTKILSDDNNLDDGIVNGNLYIKGFGNSLFTSEDLQSMVNEIREMGIIKISGKIIGDDSYFDNIYMRDDWITDEVANVKLPPISAIIIDNNKKIIQKKRRGRLRNYYVNIDNPPLNAAIVLR
ncbi:MAG TPA: D-alanyl-D-alanine carboxypeptidase, partial [Ignavibacteriaceae bacterium]|nr:D-alanyl-D-alanine carboxypeptidase [Ignavibacteriaceae bacterium]